MSPEPRRSPADEKIRAPFDRLAGGEGGGEDDERRSHVRTAMPGEREPGPLEQWLVQQIDGVGAGAQDGDARCRRRNVVAQQPPHSIKQAREAQCDEQVGDERPRESHGAGEPRRIGHGSPGRNAAGGGLFAPRRGCAREPPCRHHASRELREPRPREHARHPHVEVWRIPDPGPARHDRDRQRPGEEPRGSRALQPSQEEGKRQVHLDDQPDVPPGGRDVVEQQCRAAESGEAEQRQRTAERQQAARHGEVAAQDDEVHREVEGKQPCEPTPVEVRRRALDVRAAQRGECEADATRENEDARPAVPEPAEGAHRGDRQGPVVGEKRMEPCGQAGPVVAGIREPRRRSNRLDEVVEEYSQDRETLERIEPVDPQRRRPVRGVSSSGLPRRGLACGRPRDLHRFTAWMT